MSGLLAALPEDTNGGWLSATIDPRVLLFFLALSLVTGILFGFVPAIQATRPDVLPALKDHPGSREASGGQARIRRVFVAGQVALSLMLLVGAALFTRSLINLASQSRGFHTEQVLEFSIDPRLTGYDDARGFSLFRDLQQRLALLPGVRSVGAANLGPFGGGDRSGNITVEGYRAKEDEEVRAQQDAVSPAYFRTLRIPLIACRDFSDRDDAGTWVDIDLFVADDVAEQIRGLAGERDVRAGVLELAGSCVVIARRVARCVEDVVRRRITDRRARRIGVRWQSGSMGRRVAEDIGAA